jgi:hypothetical protein
VKGDITRLQGNLWLPLEYASIAAVLLALRIPPVRRVVISIRMHIQSAIHTSSLLLRKRMIQPH